MLRFSNQKIKAGDTVAAYVGWQQYAVSDGTGLRPVDPKIVPVSVYLGAVGMPGVTAWYGLLKIGEPKANETVVVSAAAGAVRAGRAAGLDWGQLVEDLSVWDRGSEHARGRDVRDIWAEIYLRAAEGRR